MGSMPGFASAAFFSSAGAAAAALLPSAKPVAMTVTRISSSSVSSKVAPKMVSGVGMDGLLHQVGGLLHLLQTDVHGAGDVDEHALGAVDGGLQQGAGNGHLGGLLGLALAGGAAHAHVGHAGVLHDGGHVGKVQVDEAGVPDQVGDGLHRLAQHVVGDLKGVGKGDLLIGGMLQPLVGDDDQGVHLVLQLRDAALRPASSGGGPQSRRAW